MPPGSNLHRKIGVAFMPVALPVTSILETAMRTGYQLLKENSI
jgi:hypothetical protein